MQSKTSGTYGYKWWGLFEKPDFANQKTREEAVDHFGESGYNTGELFALSTDHPTLQKTK